MASSVQEYNFTIYQGADLDVRLCLADSDGSPANLSGYAVRGVVKHRYSDTSNLLDLSPVVVSGYCPGEYCGLDPDPIISGYIDINVLANQTVGLPVGQMVYDIEKSPLDNPASVTKVIKGYFNILPEVTNE
tara:strand:- start:183 stop:578 length:396 start_codon:yes stop_codon:yes gene_type:complete